MEVARRLWRDKEKWRDFHRYIRIKNPVTPGASVAVELAHIFGEEEDAFLSKTPLREIAIELREANRRGQLLELHLQELEAKVAVLPTAEDLYRGLDSLRGPILALTSRGTRGARTAKTS